jgi:NADH:ubiquinone oxidoreductase subunit C
MNTSRPAVERDVTKTIIDQLTGAVDEAKVDRKDRISVVARKDTVERVARSLQQLGFDHTITVSGVDHPTDKKIDVVYFLSSYSRDDLKHLVLSLKVQLDRQNPSLPTLTPIWESANLFERETSEMFGVNFEGHPDPTKLLLQDNWDGPPPLRKDLKIPELA